MTIRAIPSMIFLLRFASSFSVLFKNGKAILRFTFFSLSSLSLSGERGSGKCERMNWNATGMSRNNLYSVYGGEDPLNFERVYRFTGLAGCSQLARVLSEWPHFFFFFRFGAWKVGKKPMQHTRWVYELWLKKKLIWSIEYKGYKILNVIKFLLKNNPIIIQRIKIYKNILKW